jgi:hypothetical protein
MKSSARILAIAVMMMPFIATAHAQDSQKLVAQVPFEFMVGNHMVPAGKCTVRATERYGSTVLIQNQKTSLYSLATVSQDEKTAGANALIFHKFGDRYFLVGMELAGSHVMFTLPEAKAEAELRAQNATGPEEILLAGLQ